MAKVFRISQRQYEIIMGQAQMNYPYETGGILGGRENLVLGVLPIANKDIDNPKESYGLTLEDIKRAEKFLIKNELEFLGVYHTHPKGIPYPSEQDLAYRQKYLFIIGLANRHNPLLVAYDVESASPMPVPIQVIDNKGFSVLDIKADKPALSDNAVASEMSRLNEMIDRIIRGEYRYEKMAPTSNWDSSSFSTIA